MNTSPPAEKLAAILDAMGACPPPGKNRYRVTVLEWLSHDILIDAPSAEHAEELANEIWLAIGPDAFRFKHSSTDGFVIDLLEEGDHASA